MSNQTLSSLIKNLYDSQFLDLLLHKTNVASFALSEIKDIQWDTIPYFLPSSLPRVSFKLTTPKGSYLLKLNVENKQIHREGTICKILSSKDFIHLTIPAVVAMESSIDISEGQNCGWLITKWIEGTQIFPSEIEDIKSSLVLSLVELHTIPVVNDDVLLLYSVPLPDRNTSFSLLQQRRKQYFNKLIEVCEGPARSTVEFLQDVVTNFSFSPHLSYIHGDLHVNNMKNLGRNHITAKILLFDWEDVTLDHPLSDWANLMFSENFSRATIRCTEEYIRHFNQHHSREFELSMKEAWLLASVWFARNLSWMLQSSPIDQRSIIEHKAIDTALKIIRAIGR